MSYRFMISDIIFFRVIFLLNNDALINYFFRLNIVHFTTTELSRPMKC